MMMKNKNVTKRMANVDLAFPNVIINTSSLKKARLRQRRNYYRFLAVIGLCVLLLAHVIDRTILRLPPAETRLDFSNVKAIDDLSVDNIDKWCLVDSRSANEQDANNNEGSCPCSNPLHPEGRPENEHWEEAHHVNMATLESADLETLDVIFLGDSITEGWSGKFYNRPDNRVQGALPVWQSFFSKDHGAALEGIHLGIAGDVTSELLWRIQHGEMPVNEPPNRQPQSPLVYWVLIGTNDLGKTACSADMVILGVIRVIEEIRLHQPSATIVINGLLPRTSDNKGFLMNSKDRKQPVLWPTIQIINRELKRYADKRGPQVEYFESKVFFHNSTVSSNKLRIEQELMSDFLHPNAQGYRRWGEEIVGKLESILKQDQDISKDPPQ